jgi:anthranilate synthase component I
LKHQSCKRRLSGDVSLLAMHRTMPDRWPFLLASSASAGTLGRWSMLLRADDETLVLGQDGHLRGPGRAATFLGRLREWSSALPAQSDPHLPFVGGWFVYLGYELAGEIEPVLSLPAADDALPVAMARRCRAALLQDHLDGTLWLVAEEASILEQCLAELDTAQAGEEVGPLPELRMAADPGGQFTDGVRRIREWILDGDVFQVNLSRAWRAEADRDIDPASLYAALAMANPAPFAALARLPGGTVVSSSPERLVEVRGNRVQTRPIAGTRPRGTSAGHDKSLSEELVSHPKERAEHIMLIDLERNDLGRVCETGSVEVDELMVIESYAHVHHIVSNVRGRLRAGLGAADAIAAVFPGGTITGCPKVRCMQIIAELEGKGRSFYTGALGYLGRDGSLDLNILIRSMLVDGRHLSFRTGAGIVADSQPDAELAETVAKARGLLRALGHD